MASIRNVSLVMLPLSRLVASFLSGVSAVAENHVSAVSKYRYRYRYRDGLALAHDTLTVPEYAEVHGCTGR